MARVSKLEKLRREKNIFLWITKGLQTQDILANIIEHFDVSERQAYTLLKGVHTAIYSNFKADIEDHKAKHMARLEALYTACMDIKDYSEARRVLADMAKFNGTNAPVVTKNEHTGADGEPIAVQTGAVIPDTKMLDAVTAAIEKAISESSTDTTDNN